MVCKKCGAVLSESAKFCSRCGAKVMKESLKRHCMSCGAELGENANLQECVSKGVNSQFGMSFQECAEKLQVKIQERLGEEVDRAAAICADSLNDVLQVDACETGIRGYIEQRLSEDDGSGRDLRAACCLVGVQIKKSRG